MATTIDHGKMPPATDTLSTAKILARRSEGFSQIRFYADRVAQLGTAIEQLDAALMTVQTDNSNAEQQALVDAARHLSALLDGEQPATSNDNSDFCEQARIERGMAQAPELPSLTTDAELQAEREVKLNLAFAFLQNGGKLPLATTGGAPW